MLRTWMRIPAALLLLSLSACLKVKQLVVVNPDGSGHIVVSTTVPPETASLMASFAGALDGGTTTMDPFYDPGQLREAAERFGEGVTLTKSEKIDKDGSRGSIAVYGFKDVSRIKLSLQQSLSMNEAMAALQEGKPAGTEEFIRFAFQTGTTSRLTILMPEARKPSAPGVSSNKPAAPVPPELAALGGLGGAGSLGGGAAALQMFKGMEVGFSVQVKGRVVRSNASHPDDERKDRFVLLGMDFDKLATTPGFQALLKENPSSDDPAEIVGRFYNLPGAQLETNRETIIEFVADGTAK